MTAGTNNTYINPEGRGGMSVTMKQDSREGTWIVFHGSDPAEIERNILATFEGIEKGPDMDLAELILDATSLYKAGSNAHAQLGGRRISPSAPEQPGSNPAYDPPADATPAAETPAEPETPAAPAEPVKDPILVKIEGLGDLEAHRNVWADHKARLQAEPDLMEAWKVKGAALKAAAAAA